MRVPIENRVQLLCPVLPAFKRARRPFKPFSSPVAVTQDRVRYTDNASSAVLSTADSTHTTNARPLQEQLRDQMDLHKLQREPVSEESDGESSLAQNASRDGTNNATGTTDKVFPRKGNPSRRRNKRRSTSQSDQPKTVAKKAARAARSGRAGTNEQQPEKQAPEPKHPRTLTKQQDEALCAAIKASTWLLCTASATVAVA